MERARLVDYVARDSLASAPVKDTSRVSSDPE